MREPNEPKSVLTGEGTTPIRRDLNHELAAVSLAILDKEDERKEFCTTINGELKKLKKRQRELSNEIKSGGQQLPIDFYAPPQEDDLEDEDDDHN